MNRSLCYVADFETTTDVNDCRVWAWAVCSIENPNEIEYGNSIESFLDWCSNSKENYTCYFHNARFDCEFIISALGQAGYSHIEDVKDRADCTYTTLISGMGEFYKMDVYFHVGKKRCNKVTFLDSLKVFPNFSVDRIAKSFGLPIRKLKIDYHKYRPVGHILDEEEVAYIKNDVGIVARALGIMFDNDLTKMTLASNALHNFKQHFPSFRKIFPDLDDSIDAEVRAAYRGGFTYVSPKYQEKITRKGLCLDVNSLYPSCLYYNPMPYGSGVRFDGEYKYDPTYPLYVQTLTCKFKLKPNKIPMIQIRNSYSFRPNEYVESSNDEHITLTLTNVDLELFKDQYYIYEPKYQGGVKFMCKTGFFKEYIDYWSNEKIKAGNEGNKGKRQIAKLMLNSLY